MDRDWTDIRVDTAIEYQNGSTTPIDFGAGDRPGDQTIVLGSIMPSDFNTVTNVRVCRISGTLPIVGVPTTQQTTDGDK